MTPPCEPTNKSKKRKRKHKRESSTSSDTEADKEQKKLKKKIRKEKKRAKKLRKEIDKRRERKRAREDADDVADVPIHLMDKSRAMAPMTKEEWEKKQSIIKRVLDEETGRYRLIKGDGEVLEEIVSRDRHKEINHQATHGDGAYFQQKSIQQAKNQ